MYWYPLDRKYHLSWQLISWPGRQPTAVQETPWRVRRKSERGATSSARWPFVTAYCDIDCYNSTAFCESGPSPRPKSTTDCNLASSGSVPHYSTQVKFRAKTWHWAGVSWSRNKRRHPTMSYISIYQNLSERVVSWAFRPSLKNPEALAAKAKASCCSPNSSGVTYCFAWHRQNQTIGSSVPPFRRISWACDHHRMRRRSPAKLAVRNAVPGAQNADVLKMRPMSFYYLTG